MPVKAPRLLADAIGEGTVGQNTRQLLQLILITVAFTAAVVWMAPLELNGAVWALRIFSPMTAVGMAYVVFKVSRSPGKFPDHLRERTGRYFERTGFCFAPVVEVEGGTAALCIYFQNRYARDVLATVAMQPAARSFRLSRLPLPSASVQVHCPGVGFGVARLRFPVGTEFQGKRLTFEIAADVKYPAGRGKLIRMRGGIRAGSIANLSQGTRLLKALAGALLLGLVHEEHPAKVAVVVPQGAVNSPPGGQPPYIQILWQPPAAQPAHVGSPQRAAA